MSAKIGIVLVSYNAATAVRVTLASLRAAKCDVPYDLVVVDNASREEERVEIREAMARHTREVGSSWSHVQMDQNLGFAGGNNVGIRQLLEDPSITHVCLLNSDVIVSDGWLEALLRSGHDIVSPVTNKADGEQCVPIDYEIELSEELLCKSDADAGDELQSEAFDAVNSFARRRDAAFRGNVVDCDATFFCVLLSRTALDRVGLLDETFFPGGFEDDDYCIRARAGGVAVHLARDVFLHHWGSASFGKLDFDYFSGKAAKNREFLEQKHGITWRGRYERPFLSLLQDAVPEPAAAESNCSGDVELQKALLPLHEVRLAETLKYYRREFVGMAAAIELNEAKAKQVEQLVEARTLERGIGDRWRNLINEARTGQMTADGGSDWSVRMRAFAADIYTIVACSFRMHALLTADDDGVAAAAPRPSRLRRLWSLLRHGIPFVLKLRGVVFLGGYPYSARDRDGYFQRVRAIDGMFADRWRIYFDPTPLPGQDAWYDMPAPQTLVLRGGGGSRWRRLMVLTLVWLLAIRCRFVYFHSVLRMHEHNLGRLMRLPFTRRILDVHGVVPEEFRMHGDFFSARLHDRQEELAVRKASSVIVVTESMRRYLGQKYQGGLRAQVIVLPIFPGLEPADSSRPYNDGRATIVYAGGLHKWQQVPLMIDAIERTLDGCDHRFYCTDPDAVRAMLPDEALASGRIVVDAKTHEELIQAYRECHYGFLLRADNVVNHVACPTKVVEYLAMGIVPIVDTEEVGDFAGLGMQFVGLRDFVAGQLPSEEERDRMAANNFEVYGRLRSQREAGVAELRGFVAGRARVDSLGTRLLWKAGKYLPPGSRRGDLARWAYRKVSRSAPAPAVAATAVDGPGADMQVVVPECEPCDVLVQVDNFNAGGLENVVLDLNVAFQAAGLRVGMLVLVSAGEAVARARSQGVHVVTSPFAAENYRAWLGQAKPQVVISHYSTAGAALCAEAGVPLVQVIHNTYMWLDAQQQHDLLETVPHTSLFVAVSEYVKNYSLRRLGLPEAKCRVIANGIEVARYRRSEDMEDRVRFRRGLGIPDDAFVFLSVGSINHQKNHLSLVKAFALAASRCPNAYLVIIGPPHEAELVHKCRTHVSQHQLEQRVVLAGGVSDAHRYYAMVDCYAHSAFFEGGQLSMLEALAADLPIVTTEIGFAMHFKEAPGVRVVPAHFDIVDYEGHITQMKASATSERALADAMGKTYADPVRPGLSRVEVDAFDRQNSYAAYVDLVRGLMSGKAVGSLGVEKRSWASRASNAG